ncbi:hypothetical protein TNIN_77591 [Trichonephila inaurata madagascariensis]|uniref:Uncharacterized protein n=1 Tax=Trichonephila inaurata madagascariensis TaxID=2747483 RepID=A0A8X6IS94_9ARAC|nr:hypothetical protein TNIN_77591 [Trichonephila inaurata madagascariensis]
MGLPEREHFINGYTKILGILGDQGLLVLKGDFGGGPLGEESRFSLGGKFWILKTGEPNFKGELGCSLMFAVGCFLDFCVCSVLLYRLHTCKSWC